MRNSISLIMIMFITLSASAFAVSTANVATHTKPFIKNGQLFIRTTTTTIRNTGITGVPKGLSASDALKLYRGEIGKARIKTVVRTTYSFGFPITGVQKKSVVSYKAGSWVLKDSLVSWQEVRVKDWKSSMTTPASWRLSWWFH